MSNRRSGRIWTENELNTIIEKRFKDDRGKLRPLRDIPIPRFSWDVFPWHHESIRSSFPLMNNYVWMNEWLKCVSLSGNLPYSIQLEKESLSLTSSYPHKEALPIQLRTLCFLRYQSLIEKRFKDDIGTLSYQSFRLERRSDWFQIGVWPFLETFYSATR